MSGHSKWATIKHRKETTDKKRGQTFSKLSKAIAIAARDGADPAANFKLRLEIEKAKQVNMPKANIERAIKKGSGGAAGEGSLQELTFEGFGPEGIGVIIEIVTDNRNRATAEVKNIVERGGGNLGSPGAVSYLFQPLGFLLIEKGAQPEEQVLTIMDWEVKEVEEVKEGIEVYTSPDKLQSVKEKAEAAGMKVVEAELVQDPKTTIPITDQAKAEKVIRFVEALEESDEVQKVYANFDIPEAFLG